MPVSDAERSRAAESLRGTAFRHEMDEAPVLWRVLRWQLLRFGLLRPQSAPAQQHTGGDRNPRRVQRRYLATRPHPHGAVTAAAGRLGRSDMDDGGLQRTATAGSTTAGASLSEDLDGIPCAATAAAPSQGSEEELAELEAQVLSWGCASTLAGACCALMAFALLIGLATHAYGLTPGKSSEATTSTESGAGLPGPHVSPSPR